LGAIPFDREYLQKLREVTERCGVLLLFDEIITGFRLALGGGQELFGVTPDIGLFGSAFGIAVSGKRGCGSNAERTWVSQDLYLGDIDMVDHWSEPHPSNRRHLARPLQLSTPKR